MDIPGFGILVRGEAAADHTVTIIKDGAAKVLGLRGIFGRAIAGHALLARVVELFESVGTEIEVHVLGEPAEPPPPDPQIAELDGRVADLTAQLADMTAKAAALQQGITAADASLADALAAKDAAEASVASLTAQVAALTPAAATEAPAAA